MVRLKAVALVLNGDRSSNYPSKSDYLDYGEPFINAGNLQNGKVNYTNMDYISLEKLNSLSGARIQSKDILLCLRGSLGKYAFVSKSGGVPASSIAVIRANGELMDPSYLALVVSSSIFQKQIEVENNGSSQPNLSANSVGNFLIPCPNITEQQCIAKALSDMDDLITSLEKLIEKKKAIKQGAMQELLTGKRRLPGYVRPWVCVTISDLAEVYSGGTPNTSIADYWGGSIPWMNSGELNLKIVRQVQGRITQKGYDNSSTHYIPAECVLIGLAGQGKTRGTVAFNTFSLCTNQSIAAIYPNPHTYDSKFLYYLMDTQYDNLRELSSGDGGRGGLTKSLLLNYSLTIPSDVDEQKAIATLLTDIDNEIEFLEHKDIKARQMKQGMMQQLLTGKIRLV